MTAYNSSKKILRIHEGKIVEDDIWIASSRADIFSDINMAINSIENNTGIRPNTIFMSKKVLEGMSKLGKAGSLAGEQLKKLGIKNIQLFNQTDPNIYLTKNKIYGGARGGGKSIMYTSDLLNSANNPTTHRHKTYFKHHSPSFDSVLNNPYNWRIVDGNRTKV